MVNPQETPIIYRAHSLPDTPNGTMEGIWLIKGEDDTKFRSYVIDSTGNVKEQDAITTQQFVDGLSEKADDNTVVKITGPQDIGGTKKFSSIPILPATMPSTPNQAVRKAYVDQEITNINNIIGDLEGDKYFIYEKTTPSSVWLIDHPLDKKVSVTVTDSAGTIMEGQVTLNSGTQVEIQFNVSFWGYAYLN